MAEWSSLRIDHLFEPPSRAHQPTERFESAERECHFSEITARARHDVVESHRIVSYQREELRISRRRARSRVESCDTAMRLDAENCKHVFGFDSNRRSVSNEKVRALRGACRRRSWNSHHRHLPFECRTYSDHRSARCLRLDDDEHIAQSSNDAIAKRESESLWLGAWWRFREQHSPSGNFSPHLTVFRRVDDIETRRHDANRSTNFFEWDSRCVEALQNSAMSAHVDSTCETRDDRHTVS
jgi:hypothetical protein